MTAPATVWFSSGCDTTTTVRTVFAQPDPASAREQWRRVADGFRPRYERLVALLDAAEDDVLAYLAFPREQLNVSAIAPGSGGAFHAVWLGRSQAGAGEQIFFATVPIVTS